jgi:vitamin B12 transporter
VVLPSYRLLNATSTWEIIPKRFYVFGSITNVLNEDFQEVIGYNARGRNFKVGINVLF